MRDGLAVRHFLPGALHINVNPLVIACGVCKLVDHFLINRDPVRHAAIGTDVVFQVLRGFHTQHFSILPEFAFLWFVGRQQYGAVSLHPACQ